MVLLGQQILELEAYRKVPYELDEVPTVTAMLKNARYLDEDSLHRRSLEQEPTQIQSLHDADEGGAGNAEGQLKPEVVVNNPLVTLKSISNDFKTADEADGSDDLSLSETTDDTSSIAT